MAFGKTASGIILLGAMAFGAQFPVRHRHINGGCDGIMSVDENGVSFRGPKGHAWQWSFTEIQQLKLEPRRISVLSYRDAKWRLGADREYDFSGAIPARELYAFLKERMDQRLVVAAVEQTPGAPAWSLPVKCLGRLVGSQGTLAIGAETVVYAADGSGQSRTWRYPDIDSISSSGPFQLTITTFERARSHYGDRKEFNFQLKQPITEARYNQLWLQIEKKNGRIQ